MISSSRKKRTHTLRYAAYGSNLHPVRLKERIPCAEFIGTGFVPDWSLHFHKRSQDGSGKCNIMPGGHGVYVAVFEISYRGKSRLDVIEGIGNGYVDAIIDVPQYRQCCTYLAHDSFIDDRLQPYDWYRDLVLYGCRKHRFPTGYKSKIAKLAATIDPDSARRSSNQQLLARLSPLVSV